jgi:hypothetical protein
LATQHRSISREIGSIRRSLSTAGAALGRLAPLLERLARQRAAAGPGAVATRAPLRLSPERRSALKLQGQYIGHLRNLKPRQKAQVKALRSSKGIAAAIALARRFGAS